MKFSNILLTSALAFKLIYAKQETDVLNQYEEHIETKDFHYTFHCLENFNDTCNTIKKDFIYALNILSSTFEFYQPLTFEVIIDDLSKYGYGNSPGGTMDINYITLKKSDKKNSDNDSIPPYVYTQALAKQLNIKDNSKVEYKANDFIMAFNNFKIDPERSANFERKKYSRLIIHEIIHAMGFTNNEVVTHLKDTEDMLQLSPSFISSDGSNYLKFIPNVLANIQWNQLGQATNLEQYMSALYDSKFIGISPLSIFAKHIVDVKSKELIFKDLGFYYKEFNCIKDQEDVEALKDIVEKHCLECYKKLSDKTKEQVTNIAMKYFLKSKSIGFLTDKGTVVPLQTFDNLFHPGNSIIHTQFDKYNEIRNDPEKKTEFLKGSFITKENILKYYDSEALMYYTQGDSISNEEFLETIGKSNHNGFIGSGVIEILKTMGWTEKGKERSQDEYYVDENEIKYPEQDYFRNISMKFYELTKNSKQNHSSQEKQSEKSKETVIPPKTEL